MKRKKLHRNMKASIVLALLMVMVLMYKNDIGEVHAGSSDIVIDNTSFAETLNESKWNSPNGDIEIKDAKLVFGSESTEETRLITTEAIQKSDYHEEWFHVSSTLNIKKIPEGQRFIFALGLGSVESFYEEDDSVEISFVNKGGLQVGISAYTEDGTVSLCDLKRCGISLGKTFDLYISATKEGKLTVKVGSTTIYSDIPPIELEGRVGILQTGECEAEISQLSVVSHKYERPENTDVAEDFETGTMNINKITSSMTASCGYFPTGVQVEDYNGSKVLMFRNAGTAYLATKYMYSNFEMSFDVPYMQSNIVRNEDGTVSVPAHTGFAVSIGSEKDRYKDTSYSLVCQKQLCLE